MTRVLVSLVLMLFVAQAARAQTAERRLYTMSSAMKQDLEARQFDSGQVEQVVNSVAAGLASGDLKPILDKAAPTLRITAGATNTTGSKDRLASYKARLLKDPSLRRDVVDEDQFILKGDEVGLARGTIWIDAQCLDDACSKKKSSIVTINLP